MDMNRASRTTTPSSRSSPRCNKDATKANKEKPWLIAGASLFRFSPNYFCGDALADGTLLHLGELLSSGVVVHEWAFAPDGFRVSPDERREEPPKPGTMRGANPPRICRSPLDSNRL